MSDTTKTLSTISTAFSAAISEGKIHGAHLLATDSAENFTYTETLGTRTTLDGTTLPLQTTDVCYLASATKLLTTLAALTCVEDGLLTLTDPLPTHLAPELHAKQILTGFSSQNDTPILSPPSQPITLQHLLTHSSGIVYHFQNPVIAKYRERFSASANPSSPPLSVEETFTYPLAFSPSTSWSYGPSLDWAGRIVERATNRTLHAYLTKKIFIPLGISPTDAAFFPPTSPSLRARMCDLNPSDPEGLGEAVMGGWKGVGAMNKRSKGAFGGHSLFMTPRDYLTVLKSLLANDGKVLSREMGERMFADHLCGEAKKGLEGHLGGEWGAFFRVGMEEGKRVGHGLGGLRAGEDMGVGEGKEGYFGEGTMAWGGGQTFAWFVDRKKDLCGLVAVQAKILRKGEEGQGIDVPRVMELKQVFREGVYREREVWRGGKRERAEK